MLVSTAVDDRTLTIWYRWSCKWKLYTFCCPHYTSSK